MPAKAEERRKKLRKTLPPRRHRRMTRSLTSLTRIQKRAPRLRKLPRKLPHPKSPRAIEARVLSVDRCTNSDLIERDLLGVAVRVGITRSALRGCWPCANWSWL